MYGFQKLFVNASGSGIFSKIFAHYFSRRLYDGQVAVTANKDINKNHLSIGTGATSEILRILLH